MFFIFFLFISYLLSVSQIQCLKVEVKEKCQCSDLKNQNDCEINCNWKRDEKKCEDRISLQKFQGYCSNVYIDCNKIEGCGYINKQCMPFTGCTAFNQKSNLDCQSYSYKCITDGMMCVEKGKCEQYKTKHSCRQNYEKFIQKGYCFWDGKGCRKPKECTELPLNLNSDQQCREQLNWCTYQENGGCIDSGMRCVDQKLQKQCISNKLGTQKCYWNGLKCMDYLCKYIDKDCIENGCTYEQNGKCIDRQECSEYKNEVQCRINKQNELCIWENGKCYIRSCENASLERRNNEQCQQIDQKCITKDGGGCKENGECDQADNLVGCQKNIRREECFWNDNECVLKQCQWASIYYQTQELCKIFDSKCVYNGQECIENSCNALNIQEKCQLNFQCKWVNQCDLKTCENASRDLQHINHQDCANYMKECTLHDRGIGCMNIKNACSSYHKQSQCYQSRLSLCAWYNNQCLEFRCEYFSHSTHQDCNTIFKDCTTNGIICISLQQDCSSYFNSISCNIDSNYQKCFWNIDKCQQIECQHIPKTISYKNHQQCNNFINTCTSSYYQSNCIELPNDCNLLDESQCKIAKCIFDQGSCRYRKCNDHRGESSKAICESYLDNKICMRASSDQDGCIEKPKQCSDIKHEYQCFSDINQRECQWIYQQCIDSNKLCLQDQNLQIQCNYFKECTDYINENIKSNEICEDYLISCTLDLIDKMKCMTKMETNDKLCRFYVSQKRCKMLDYCYWTQNKLCKNLEENCSNMQKLDCQLNKDIKGRKCRWVDNKCIFECLALSPQNIQCSQVNSQCVIDEKLFGCTNKYENCSDYSNDLQCIDDQRCIWRNMACLERQCRDILKQNYNHDQCNQYKSTCTVAYVGGCDTLLDECSKYQQQQFCLMKINQQKCIWNELNQCVDLICENIPISNCHQYFPVRECIFNLGTQKCESLRQSCIEYLDKDSCIKQQDGLQCIWINDNCQLKNCETLILSEYSHENCFSEINSIRCTINNNNSGCIDLKDNCEEYELEDQCYLTRKSEECFWDISCKLKKCKDYNEDEQCSPYSLQCINTVYQCRNILCEDYEYNNDQECKQNDIQCTSNGINCIARVACIDTLYQQACNIDINYKLCGWNDNLQLCEYLTCNEAPKEKIDCEFYFPLQDCIPQAGGGCLKVLNCYDYTIEQYCNDSKLFKCIWKDFACKNKVCDDYFGSTFLQCQSQQSNCTTDGNKCIEMQLCSKLSQISCILGKDGPCLYVNNQCFQFSSCQSLPFKTHYECYDSMFSQCTSNGSNCIPITTCEDYNNQISCIIDNNQQFCAWVDHKCTNLQDCQQYKLTTHQECQSINPSCTVSNNQIECSNLQYCQYYKLPDNCKFSNYPIIKNNFIPQQTCIWTLDKCFDVQCEDLLGSTHIQCNKQMKKCTSDGLRCLIIQDCESYSINQCNAATSLKGKCQATSSGCQLIDCTSLNDQQTCNLYTHCQFINQRCQSLLKCEYYQTQEDCTIGLQNSQCIFKDQSCQQSRQCSDFNQQNLCNQYVCHWNQNRCEEHTCQTYSKINKCTSFYNYNNTLLTFCDQDNQQNCISIDNLSSFNQSNCYQQSFEYYYFNQDNQTCQPCNIQNETKLNKVNLSQPILENSWIQILDLLIMIIIIL
ncbi:unnamed protein product [Paramecium sonneborni]|uniref:Uncharacterized protein n=1 Tax=Paramecium sonneborni TaxID=65129 RepID=A0A8S1MYD6_9CILI|nr:unnamed protein product [Paramecium sonneborni]